MAWDLKVVPDEIIKEKANEWNLSSFLTTLLINKGFSNKDDVFHFLNQSLNDLRSPFDFEMMEKVVDKIISHKNNKIYIYGDYDVDGITAAVFLVLALKEIGFDVDFYIPSRMEEGYGLDAKTIDLIHENNGKLIITVDTSMNSSADITHAHSLGIDIIVTDHHKSVEEEDNRLLYINPKLSKSYSFKFLSGAGVALKVAEGVFQKLNLNLDILYQFIDIVMIGTVADVVPVIDENRIIISEGLKKLKTTKIKGLTYLSKYLKLVNKDISTTDISYFVSPLINSLGRLGNSKLGADFFIKTDDFEIYNIIEEMKKSNKQRRELERTIFNEVSAIIESRGIENLNYIFASSDKWHPGIIGVVASRLSVKFNIPVFIIAIKNGIAKASCRSVNDVNIFYILKEIEDRLIRFGGHDLAAGFIAKEEDLETIENLMSQRILSKNHVTKEVCKLDIEMVFPIENITDEILGEIKKLSPFGIGNPHPYFLDKDIELKNIKYFGIEDRHFNGTLEKNGKKFPFVAFDLSHKLISKNSKYDIVFYPEKIVERDNEFFQLRLKDIQSTNL